MNAVLAGLTAAGASFAVLYLVELAYHKLTKNPNRSYRWGVVVFAVLIGMYEYLSRLGT